CSFFIDQSCSMNQVASQSRSSGCVGRFPILPKLFAVATIPFPKWYCQTRFTMTRAVSVLFDEAIHWARVRRRPSKVSGIVFQAEGEVASLEPNTALRTPGTTASPGVASDPPARMRIAGTGPSRLTGNGLLALVEL